MPSLPGSDDRRRRGGDGAATACTLTNLMGMYDVHVESGLQAVRAYGTLHFPGQHNGVPALVTHNLSHQRRARAQRALAGAHARWHGARVHSQSRALARARNR